MIAELEGSDNKIDNDATQPTTSTSSTSKQQSEQQPIQQHEQTMPPQPATGNRDDGDSESAYHLKWFPWNLGKIPIVMQSINGPCPLIAIMNVLLLREKVKFPQMLQQITETQLLAYIGECIMDSIPPELQNDENAQLNMEQNIHDAIEILPKLKSGLDVNIRFTGITDFEYTPECIIFDLLRIPLYHGWLCDPSLTELQNAIGNQSYNQLIDNIITNKTSQDPDKLIVVLMAEEFLLRTASQLTLHGLSELKTKIKDNEIGILFRNNHFLTLFKREGCIYTLVTDHGYLTEDNIIWESLDNIEGAGRYFDSNFSSADTTTKQVSELNSIDQRQQQLENDFLMALSLSNRDNPDTNLTLDSGDNAQEASPATSYDPVHMDDFELAKRLQDEEYIASSGIYGNSGNAIVEWNGGNGANSALCDRNNVSAKVELHPYEDEFPLLGAAAAAGSKQTNVPTRQQSAMKTNQISTEQFSNQSQQAQPPDYQHRPSEPSLDTHVRRHDSYGVSMKQESSSTAPRAIATTSRSHDDIPATHSNRTPSSSGRRSRSEKNTKDSNCIIS